MKDKTVIKILCIALAMIVLGGFMTIAAAFSGGKLAISHSQNGIFNFIKWSDNREFQTDPNFYSAKNEVINFQADIDFASIKINKGTTFSISTENIKKSDISVNEENGKYHFKVSQDDIEIIGNNDGGIIYVTLPESVKTININQSLGGVTISDTNISKLTIHSAMGNVDLTNVTFDEGDISLNLGSFTFEGDCFKKLTLVNHMGDGEIHLMRAANEYNYHLNVNMGEIIINDYQHGNINASYHLNNDKEVTIDAKLDMGSLKLRNEYHH